jgi:hypothetical protein
MTQETLPMGTLFLLVINIAALMLLAMKACGS